MTTDDTATAQEVVRDLLEHIVESFELQAEVSVVVTPEELVGTVDGDDLGLFIGRHGATIDAIQHLAQRALVAQDLPGRVVIDAEGYRARRREILERQADEAADRAVEDDRPVRLEPMNPAERRIVHEHLRDRGGFETHSEGNEPERRLVITPTQA